MPACTPQEFKDWSGSSLPDARLSIFLEDARRAVIRDGVAEEHADFHRLHRLRTVMELPGAEQMKFREVVAKSIAGVSTAYGSADGARSPMENYRAEFESVIGLTHRIQ